MQPLDFALEAPEVTDAETQDIVRETLADVTPRAAALALLRFGDYLRLIRKAGVETTPHLCTALFDELRSVCLRDEVAESEA